MFLTATYDDTAYLRFGVKDGAVARYFALLLADDRDDYVKMHKSAAMHFQSF